MPETPINRIEFYKEAYYKEIEIKSNLNYEITLQGTVLTALLSAVFYLATNFQSPCKVIHTLFLICCLGTLGIIIYGGYHLFISYYDFQKKGRTYKYLPSMNAIENKYFSTGKDEERFKTYLISVLAKARDNNAKHNKAKSELLTYSSEWIGKSFGCGVAIIFLYLLNLIVTPYLSSNRKISNIPKVTSYRNKSTIRSTQPASTTATSIRTDSTSPRRKADRGGSKTGRLSGEKRKTQLQH